jgi:histidine ammonia-lyase
MTVVLDGERLSIASVVRAATDPSVRVAVGDEAWARCAASRRTIEAIVESGRPVYGVNTGFGDLARVRIPADQLARLQRNLIYSHAIGVGRPFADDVVRATLILRANTLAKGVSGVRRELLELLVGMINHDVLPVIPEKGSLGASGDLAPLAHMSLVLIGEGQARAGGALLPGAEALARAGLAPLALAPKEGLALINGTPVMTAIACLVIARSLNVMKAAAIVAALSTEALRGTDAAFGAELHALRPHRGQTAVAAYLRALLDSSGVIQSHRDCPKVQDPYSIRCIPQVHGACLDAWEHCHDVVQVEVNSATDNPLVIGDRVVTGGNFHGEPVGLAMDFLAMALAELGSISERRSARLMDAHLSDLPPFLVEASGLNTGMMITQYTAAALVMENRILAHPATVDSLPTSADQEDHVSMATTAARKAAEVLVNLTDILSLELLDAVQGLEFLRPLAAGKGTEAAYRLVRERVPFLVADRPMTPDLDAVRELVTGGRLVREVEAAAGLPPRPSGELGW